MEHKFNRAAYFDNNSFAISNFECTDHLNINQRYKHSSNHVGK